MDFKLIEECFPVGSKVRVISHGETVVGTLKELSAPATIVLLRADTGHPHLLDCEKVENISYAEENSTQPLQPPEPTRTQIHNGSLIRYDIYTNYGTVRDSVSGNKYGFKISAVTDPQLRQRLQDGSKIHNLPVQFTLKLLNNGKEMAGLLHLDTKENFVQPKKANSADSLSTGTHTTYNTEKSDAFKRGNDYFAEKNYRQAASFFEDSILDNRFFKRSLNKLIFIYIIDYGEDINAQVEKGLRLLDKYESRLSEDFVINSRIQLLARTKPKRTNELIAEYKKAIACPGQPAGRIRHYQKQIDILCRKTQHPNISANVSESDNDEEDFATLVPYVQYRLDQFSLKTFVDSQRRLLKSNYLTKFENNDFTGTVEEADKIITKVLDNLDKSGDDERSNGRAFAAKLISKVYAANSFERERFKNSKITRQREHEYAAQFMGYAGNWELQQGLNPDVARFFFNEAMKIMPKGRGNARDYLVKLLASFSVEPAALAKRDPGGTNDDLEFLQSCAADFDKCSNPKGLLVNTFLLPSEVEKFTFDFLDKLSADSRWCQEAEKLFAVLLSEEISLSEKIFKMHWKQAKDAYRNTIEKFEETLISAAQNCDNAANNSAGKIDEMFERVFPSQTDTKRLNRYRTLLATMSKIADKFTFEEKESDFINVIDICDELIKDIYREPTKLSFEKLRKALECLKQKAETALKKLYESSVPTLTFKRNIIGSEQFSVIVENKENCQTAVNLKVEVKTIDSNIELKVAGKSPTAVRGGSASEFLYDVVLSDEEKNHDYFEVMIHVSYSYRVAKGETKEDFQNRPEHIPLLNREDYEEIDNVYSSLAESNGVSTESNLFYGRDEDINKIVEMLQLPDGSLLKHRGIIMYGQKRAGKTSIMKHLTKKIRDSYGQDAYIIVDVGSVGDLQRSFAAFLSKIISRLENTLRKDHKDLFKFLREREVNFAYREIEKDDTSEASRIGTFERSLESILDAIREFDQSENKFIPLFLIDEFTYFYKWIKDGNIDGDFMKFWKAFLENNPVCAIIIGMDHMPQFINEYANEFACMQNFPVHFLKEQYTKDLVDIPIRLKDGSSRYKDKPGQEALSYIYQLTAGSAYLTVIFCKAFVEYLNERKTTFVTHTVIDNFVKEKLLGTRPVLQETMFDPQLQDPGKFSDEEQAATYADNKAVLTYIALKADNQRHEISRDQIDCFDKLSEKTPEHRDAVVERLKNRKVLTQRGDYYRIEIELLRMWLLREIGKDF